MRPHKSRFEADRATRWLVIERFLAACRSGDTRALLESLAPDVTLCTDGGGKVRSALNPIRGFDKVAPFYAGIRRRGSYSGRQLRLVRLNGEPGGLLRCGDVPVAAITTDIVGGRVQRIYSVSNPDKLAVLRVGHEHGMTSTWNRAFH